MNLNWKKPSKCGVGGECVEVAQAGDVWHLRDSKSGEASPVLTFTTEEWDAFKAGVRAGEFD